MEKLAKSKSILDPVDTFVRRHIGSSDSAIEQMLETLGLESLDAMTDAVLPAGIRLAGRLALDAPRAESEVLDELQEMAGRNAVFRSFIGMGYHDCLVPGVILRNVLENPGWYTQYTAYQSEISQGRLEALLNFQTMVADLTGLPVSNASLLDEATAAAEAMSMCRAITRSKRSRFYVAQDCHPQTVAVVCSRARPLGVQVEVVDPAAIDFSGGEAFGLLLQYPTSDGHVVDYDRLIEASHAAGTLVVVATDLLALTLLRPPGEFGADIAVGSTQRFGVPLGFGGPHAAFVATGEKHKRQIPGRIVGVARDDRGRRGLRLAMQTREQHIRREKATSNICTAQVLLAVMAGMYAVYHGPEGLRRIALRVRALTLTLAEGLRRLGLDIADGPTFDTLRIDLPADAIEDVRRAAEVRRINLRYDQPGSVGVSLDEACRARDLQALLEVFAAGRDLSFSVEELAAEIDISYAEPLARTSAYLQHDVFRRYHSEHEMLRYLHRLQSRDLSLTQSMIPLGSCTMKLNATSQMIPISWPAFASLHPFAPVEQSEGYTELFRQLEGWLCEITGFDAFSLQPNAGAQGEYAGLLTIRAYHEQRGEVDRKICLIPTSAHGTNPASAIMAGLDVVPVACDERGDIDLDDLRARAEKHRGTLAALMITYPSTHGVFESGVKEVCEVVHAAGGQVFMDGANMNAQVGVCRPADIGADVCHLNLHKTFCIPHGGGGPGMGPIGVKAHLSPYLPGHPMRLVGGGQAIGPVSAAPYGSPSILPISWVYIAMMGEAGLKKATQVAILNANYMAGRLASHYELLYSGRGGLVAHEFILDLRPLQESAGITVDDVAKRLMDFGLHAPTMSWPVAGTLMIEPTESESLDELNRFCEAMITIRDEIREIEDGKADRENNLLKRAPHTAEVVAADVWDRPYSRERAAFPADWVRERKFWPSVGRIDNAWGDRHLMCTCG